MEPESFRKQASSLVLFVLAVAAVFALAVRMQSDPAKEKAQFIAEQLLSCTVHVDDAADTSTASGTEPGLAAVDSSGLYSFFRAQFADCVTEECLEEMLLNRLPTRITAFAEQYGDKLEPIDLQITRRSGDAVRYQFSADLQTVSGQTIVGTASGSITMIKTDGVWKASAVSLTLHK